MLAGEASGNISVQLQRINTAHQEHLAGTAPSRLHFPDSSLRFHCTARHRQKPVGHRDRPGGVLPLGLQQPAVGNSHSCHVALASTQTALTGRACQGLEECRKMGKNPPLKILRPSVCTLPMNVADKAAQQACRLERLGLHYEYVVLGRLRAVGRSLQRQTKAAQRSG